MNKKIKVLVGARGSPLSVVQTKDALAELHKILPAIEFNLREVSTPGDRDKRKDLRISPADFFTKDLDDALLTGKIDFAVHSAKDLPDPMPEGIDWFWLPWSEDARDVIIMPETEKRRSGELARRSKSKSNLKLSIVNCQLPICIGVSSARREEYCRKRFPDAELFPVRGNIEARIAQLDAGKFDMLIMAAAGLNRLGLDNRISEYIPLNELLPPEGQGFLAVTFRENDRFFCEVRKLFVKAAVFAGAGPGDANLATVETVNALKNCEICLYDALISCELLKNLPHHTKAVYVGKRMSAHGSSQQEINALIAKFARQGKRIVRLKGGDPTIFGRLAEETETLDGLSLPYRVIPGVSSMNAVGVTGLMLTRRGLSRGFSVMTPRKSGSSKFEHVSKEERLAFPSVFFMGLSETANIAKSLIKDGCRKDEPAAVVLSAGNESAQEIISGSLGEFACSVIKIPGGESPGIFIVGENANPKYVLKKNGALAGKKILLTCSESIMDKAADEIYDFGGIPIRMPMIKLEVAQASRLCSFSPGVPPAAVAQASRLCVSEILPSLSESERNEYYTLFSEKIQNILDSEAGDCLLRNKGNAQIVADAMLFFDNQRYKLGHWVIMPNHVHLVVKPINGYKLSDILHSWKSYTAKMINKNTGRDGGLWQDESYDHIVRNLKELKAIEKYIFENPEKAGVNSFLGSWNYPDKTGGTPEEIHRRDACATSKSGGTPQEHRQDACATAREGKMPGEYAAGFVGFDYANSLESTERNLPHWNQNEVTYFVTFRMADSIPAGKIKEINYEREMWLKRISLAIKKREEHRQDACATARSGETPQEHRQDVYLPMAAPSATRACATAFDWIILTSPASVKIFIEVLKNRKYDFRCLPKIMVCGPGTAEEFQKQDRKTHV